jgi:polyhydroxybutyrate depolymerase
MLAGVRVRIMIILLFAVVVGGCGGGEEAPGDGGAGVDAAAVDASALPDSGVRPDAGPSGCGGAGLEAGDHTMTIDWDDRTRTYHVHVPPSYDGSAAVPLVLNFHGYTSNAGQQIVLSGMNEKADAEGFIAVHAEGWGGAQSWNGGLCCGAASSEELDDVGLVRAVLDDVAALACIDRARVYARGLSNGGFLSHRLGCQAGDVIAAIAPVAGVIGIPDEECTPPRAVPVMHFHGTSDTLVPYDGGGFSGFPSVADTMAGWVERNGCTIGPDETYAMGDSRCETWTGCSGGVSVTLCTVEGGGHWWPGGPGSTTDIDATEAMWEFLSAYSLHAS